VQGMSVCLFTISMYIY